jgi:hypothetical protein
MFMMFKKYNINPELSKYMIEENNKWSKKYSTKSVYENAVSGQNVNNLVMLKAKYLDDQDALNLEAMSECNFLFTYYTDLYNKIRKDEIDLKILFQFCGVFYLQSIIPTKQKNKDVLVYIY